VRAFLKFCLLFVCVCFLKQDLISVQTSLYKNTAVESSFWYLFLFLVNETVFLTTDLFSRVSLKKKKNGKSNTSVILCNKI